MRERELQRIHESFHRPSQNRLDLFSHCRQTTFLTSRASRLHCLLCCSFSAFASIVSFLHTIHLDKNHRRHYIVVSSNNDNISFMMMTTAISRTCTSSPLTRASYLPSLLTTPSTTATTTTAFLPPAQHDLNHASVQAVLDSWKNCRNSFQETHDFDEAFGKLLLIRVFALEPRIKLLFGFHVNIDPTATPLGEMALIMRAVRLTHQLHQVLEMVSRFCLDTQWKDYSMLDII